MRSLKKFFAIQLCLIGLLSASNAVACGDWGCDSWGGIGIGDYNLYSFGSDLYNIGSYGGYSDYGYGGGCGSFYGSCGGGYDTAGLYGDSWGLGSYGGLSIDIDINLMGSYDWSSYGSGYGYSDWNNCNPYAFSNYDMGCSIGYCDGGMFPYYGSDYSSSNPWYDPWSNYGNIPYYGNYPVDPYYTSYPMPQYPSWTQIPRDPYGNPPYFPQPPTTPIYGMCDNVIIMCPTGPVTRFPQPIPRNRYDLPRDPGTPVNYPPVTYPPTNYPPVVYPQPPTHGNPPIYPPVNNPPVNYPPVTYPPVTYPPVNFPPVNNPPTYPPVNLPPTASNPPPANVPPYNGGSIGGSRPPVRNELPRGN